MSIVATALLPAGLILAAPPKRGLAQLRRLIDIAAASGAILILAWQDRGAEAVRTADRVVLLLLDLDGFKPVNDTLGHAGGGEALVTVAHRLTAALRPGDVACRLGGDEFAVLLTDVSDDDVMSLARRVLSAIGEPMTIHGPPVAVGVSIGVTSSQPGAARTLDVLLRQADEAMYEAKAHGKGTVRCYRTVSGVPST